MNHYNPQLLNKAIKRNQHYIHGDIIIFSQLNQYFLILGNFLDCTQRKELCYIAIVFGWLK